MVTCCRKQAPIHVLPEKLLPSLPAPMLAAVFSLSCQPPVQQVLLQSLQGRFEGLVVVVHVVQGAPRVGGAQRVHVQHGDPRATHGVRRVRVEQLDALRDGRTNSETGGQPVRRTDGQTVRWADRLLDGRTDKQ